MSIHDVMSTSWEDLMAILSTLEEKPEDEVIGLEDFLKLI